MTIFEEFPSEILASTPPDEIHIISEERAKSITDLATFAETVRSFTYDDYCTDVPYVFLARSSQYSWNQYHWNK